MNMFEGISEQAGIDDEESSQPIVASETDSDEREDTGAEKTDAHEPPKLSLEQKQQTVRLVVQVIDGGDPRAIVRAFDKIRNLGFADDPQLASEIEETMKRKETQLVQKIQEEFSQVKIAITARANRIFQEPRTVQLTMGRNAQLYKDAFQTMSRELTIDNPAQISTIPIRMTRVVEIAQDLVRRLSTTQAKYFEYSRDPRVQQTFEEHKSAISGIYNVFARERFSKKVDNTIRSAKYIFDAVPKQYQSSVRVFKK